MCPFAFRARSLLDFFRELNVVVSKLSAYLEARGSSSKQFSQQAQLKEYAELVVVFGLLAKKYKVKAVKCGRTL